MAAGLPEAETGVEPDEMSKPKKTKKKPKVLAVEKRRGAIGKQAPEMIELLETAIKSGLSNKKACELVGINPTTFYRWMESEEFCNRIKRARAEKCKTYADGIRAAGFGEMDAECPQCRHSFKIKMSQKQWQAIAWLAERTEPEEFGSKEYREQRSKDENGEKVTQILIVRNDGTKPLFEIQDEN
jgi:hypothetical protein